MFKVKNLRARENSGQKCARLFGKQDKMTMGLGFFKSFEESVLGGFIHGVSWGDDEEALGSFAVIGETKEITHLFDGDYGSGFRLIGIETERIFEF